MKRPEMPVPPVCPVSPVKPAFTEGNAMCGDDEYIRCKILDCKGKAQVRSQDYMHVLEEVTRKSKSTDL